MAPEPRVHRIGGSSAPVRPLRVFVVLVAMLFFNLIFPTPATAAMPVGMLAPGAYQLSDYTLGLRRTSSLVVSDAGEYKQRFNTGSGVLEVWPVQSTSLDAPFRIGLTDLNLGGLYFEPSYGDMVTYRPYRAPGVLDPNVSGWWSMDSGQAGGIFMTGEYDVGDQEFLMVDGTPVLVQKIDFILDLGGPNADGLIRHTHWEVPGSTTDFRDDFFGWVTVLGSRNIVHTSVTHGLLAG